MLRKIVGAFVMFALCVTATMAYQSKLKAEEIKALITKVDPEKGTISYKTMPAKKGDAPGDEVTTKVDAKATFFTGKRDPDKKGTIIEGDSIPDGLKADVFAKIGDKGLPARLTTNDDKAISKVVVVPMGKKKE